MGMTIHLCMDVQGFLENHVPLSSYEGIFNHDGRVMNAREARSYLLRELAAGHRVIPTIQCDNFDFQKGCLGHPDA